ncbi:rhomboid family intramembrane serine protease [Lacisediminihabitans sp.]|uniref:rhomboid family intramembrane serine protease n=1 Tax=Lacisediminihabitans sp. TaxID=2787631 RepID=UPI00374CAB86
MSAAPPSSDNYCYRHPDRQSYVLCQRCGRTICPECQTVAAVGVHCPECVKEARQSAPRTRPAIVTSMRRAGRSDSPLVTYSIIAVCVIVFVAEQFLGGTGGAVFQSLVAYGPLTITEPWRLLTSIFVHLSILHLLFNMYSLFIFGPILERLLGRGRFAALFFLSGLGGSVAVLLIAPAIPVAGASGAIFGLLGAFFVIQRHLGGNNVQLLIVIALNLVIGFVVPNIAWQAHVGGLIVGAAVALIFVRTRDRKQRVLQFALLGVTLIALIGLTVYGAATVFSRI